jgi:chloramphenicol 3-O phosphotransferase
MFGVDTFIDMIPFGKQESYLKFIPGQNECGPTMHVEVGPNAQKLFGVMPRFAEILANQENNLIIDEVLLGEDLLKAYAKALKNYTVYYIGIFCDLKVMQQREILRRDRCIGFSNDQMDRVHKGALNSYDFKVDTTSISPFEAAERIFKFMDGNPAPQAFQKLISKE